MLEIKFLVLIGIANGVPVIIKRLFGERFATPLDFGRSLSDGYPLFGSSKTYRGLISALIVTALCAPVLGLPWSAGIMVAAAAMTGDLVSSFIKRRLSMASSSMALGLDQVPEALLPMLLAKMFFDVSWLGVAAVVGVFFIAELVLSKILYHLKIRDEPY
jgi:CDP-2,3-bis-(O-geranylgeranyl)-sn-glycerol synthase